MNIQLRILTLGLAITMGAAAISLSQTVKAENNIYDEKADARAEIKDALQKASAEHKRVILVFGANWCYDCHVLDRAFHSSELAPIIAANYEVVHVDIGKGEKNQDLMASTTFR
jgi:thioredoxin 1